MQRNCSGDEVQRFEDYMSWQLTRVNALLAVSPMVMAVLVGIGAYAPRYRHHPLTRFIFHGAAALFMPIVSYLVSATNNIGFPINETAGAVTATCDMHWRSVFILEWTGLVQIIGVSSIVVVAADVRELGRSIAPSAFLLVQAIWNCYLVIHTLQRTDFYPFGGGDTFQAPVVTEVISIIEPYLPITICALIFAKLVCKFCAFFMARQSFSLGRNPRLVAGYMRHLHVHADQTTISRQQPLVSASEELVPPPPLVVMGEDTVNVVKWPHGYSFSDTLEGLVTIDKVWQLMDDTPPFATRSMTQGVQGLKDVCLSFALFKLLRCRFARYTVDEVCKVRNFFWQGLLKDHTAGNDARVLNVVADELSFLHDYYYSSLPIFYSRSWLPILSFSISLFTISYGIFQALEEIAVAQLTFHPDSVLWQIGCAMQCQVSSGQYSAGFGNSVFDIVTYTLLAVLVVLAEARDIASYACSNWTKVAFICHYVVTNHDKWKRSPSTRKWVGCLLQCRCKLVNKPVNDDVMNQCSILALHYPRKRPMLSRLLRRHIPLPEQKKKVKVPKVVKSAIIDKLRSSEGLLTNIPASVRCQSIPLQVKGSLLRACSGEGAADVMLVWHIATSILEVRRAGSSESDTNNVIVATHLSGYCAYLVAYCPELLPDDDGWSKDLYKAVAGDAQRALAVSRAPLSSPEEEYQQLVGLLSADSRHEVVKNGAKLAEQLVALVASEGEEKVWELLAGFWSEMILYVAPSDNLEGHADAIARGGELITLLWALLTHAGVVSRPVTAANNDSTGSAV